MLGIGVAVFCILPAGANLMPCLLNFVDCPLGSFLCFLGGLVRVFAYFVRRLIGLFFRRPYFWDDRKPRYLVANCLT